MTVDNDWNISNTKNGRRWELDVSPSIIFPEELGQGSIRLLGMHGGFQFCSFEGAMTQPSRVYCTDPSKPEERVALMLVASLQGTLGLKPGGFSRPIHIDEGNVAVYPISEPDLVVEMSPTRQRGMDVGFSRTLLQKVGSDIPLPESLRRLAEGENLRPFALPGRLDGRLGLLINDLMANPYSNGAARVYQEAKGLEIIALLMDALDTRKGKRYTRWKRRDIELLLEAKARLTSNLANPPSMIELAHTIGMSPTKLKSGFREVLGTTITDTLREARLQLAKHLLQASQLPLKAIASECGFCDASSLSHAFVRHFGVTPGVMRHPR